MLIAEGTIFKIEHQNKYAKTCGSVDSEEEANGEKDVEGDANGDTQAQEDIRYAKYYVSEVAISVVGGLV